MKKLLSMRQNNVNYINLVYVGYILTLFGSGSHFFYNMPYILYMPAHSFSSTQIGKLPWLTQIYDYACSWSKMSAIFTKNVHKACSFLRVCPGPPLKGNSCSLLGEHLIGSRFCQNAGMGIIASSRMKLTSSAIHPYFTL
jgi:hypothetical protein